VIQGLSRGFTRFRLPTYVVEELTAIAGDLEGSVPNYGVTGTRAPDIFSDFLADWSVFRRLFVEMNDYEDGGRVIAFCQERFEKSERAARTNGGLRRSRAVPALFAEARGAR